MDRRDMVGSAWYRPNVLAATEKLANGAIRIVEHLHDRFDVSDDSHSWGQLRWEWNVVAYRKAERPPVGSIDVEVWYDNEDWWIRNKMDRSIPFSVFMFSLGLVDG